MQTLKKAVAYLAGDNGPLQTTDAQSINLNTPRRNSARITPRLMRLASALLSASRTVRELTDLIPATNPAAYVERLREQGLSIPCEHVPFVTIDGQSSWYGLYSLTDDDRAKLQAMLASVGGDE